MGQPTFAVLGPLLVSAGGAPIRIGGRKPSAILATLLLQPSRSASVDVLTEVLWPSGAPPSAVANIRTYVNVLRKTLAAGGLDPRCVRTDPSGYRLEVPDDDVDLVCFERLLRQARSRHAVGEDTRALQAYDAALGLWRGRALQDLTTSVVWDPVLTHLGELRAAAVEERAELHLALGRYETVVADLRAILAEDPVRENLWRMLVQALHQTGRTAEARSAYNRAETVLATELGVSPGVPLRQLGDQITANHPDNRCEGGCAAPVPVCQLPMDIVDFTGREPALESLRELLRSAGQSPVVAVLSGAPGVGKTTLAVRLAHQVRDAFPDGQLFVEMGAVSGSPRHPADVLAELLRCLGLPDPTIPADLRERAAVFRARLANRRVLVVLDDVPAGDQVRHLLPGTGGSAVLMTSRRRLPDVPGRHCEVDVMEHREARGLFAAIVGEDRVRDETADTDQVLAACGLLPLAVRIAGARLANRPGWTIRELASSLHAEDGRLDQLRAGGLEVRASADLSYRALSPSAAATFRALGQLPHAPLPGWIVSAVGRRSPAPDDLETLLTEHLLQFVGADRIGQPRYQLHGLLHAYASELAADDPPPERRAGQQHLVRAFTDLARTANQRMSTRFFGIVGHPPRDSSDIGHTAETVRRDPVAWFETERHLLVASVDSAVALGLAPAAAELAVELAGYFDLRGHYRDWLHTHRVVLRALPTTPDRSAASLLRNMGQLHLYQDRYDDALAAFEQSRRMLREMGDGWAESVAAIGTGSVHRILGDSDTALDDFTSALHHFDSADDQHGQTVAHNAIASVWLDRGRPDKASPWLRTALRLSSSLSDRHREAQVRRRMAVLHEMEGDRRGARRQLETALVTFDDLGDAHCAAYVQQAIAELCLREGRPTVASSLLTDALSVQRQLGDRRAVASATSLLGELNQATGRTGTARRYFQSSLSAWRQLAQQDQVALIDARLRDLE